MKRFLGIVILLTIGMAAFAGKSYNFFFMSDTHMQDPSSYNTDPAVGKVSTKDYYRANRYMSTFEMMMRRMVTLSNAQTMMLVSGGDFIEGCCKDSQVHAYQLRKQIGIVRRFLPARIPFLMAVGNHDAVGNGGQEGFDEVVPPMTAQEFGFPEEEIEDQEHAWMYDGDLFILLNSYGINCSSKTALEFLQEAINEFGPQNPRYVFVINHPNMLSSGSAKTYAQILNGYKAIYLNGHSHENKITIHDGEYGRQAEVVIGTMYNAPARFGNLNRNTSTPASNIPISTFYQYRSGTGFVKLLITDSGVTAELYSTVPNASPIRIRLI